MMYCSVLFCTAFNIDNCWCLDYGWSLWNSWEFHFTAGFKRLHHEEFYLQCPPDRSDQSGQHLHCLRSTGLRLYQRWTKQSSLPPSFHTVQCSPGPWPWTAVCTPSCSSRCSTLSTTSPSAAPLDWPWLSVLKGLHIAHALNADHHKLMPSCLSLVATRFSSLFVNDLGSC